jgi:hypothetical protein
MVSLSNHMSGVLFRGLLTPFDKLRVSGQERVSDNQKTRDKQGSPFETYAILRWPYVKNQPAISPSTMGGFGESVPVLPQVR